MARVNSQENPSGPQGVTIIRYPNRRLYDRSQSKYVTLTDIEEMIRQGAEIQVLDSKSGEDLTRSILAQIILDQHPERMDLFPIPVLHTMIRANDMVLESLRSYLHQSLTVLDFVQSSSFNPFAASSQWMKAFLPLPATKQSSGETPNTAETEKLNQRVAELERRLAELMRSTDQSDSKGAESTTPQSGKTRAAKKKKQNE